MKWENDPHRFYKELIFDAILAFGRIIKSKEMYEISIRDIYNFVDDFFEKRGF
jgi:hypothetical protein